MPIDFARDSLADVLAASGFDRTRPAVIAWLGVVMYLERDAVMDTLALIASLPAGSALVFDYAQPPEALRFVPRLFYRRMLARLEAQGEPWTSFFEPGALQSDLRRLGFRDIDNLSGAEINQRYLAAHGDRLKAGSVGGIVIART